MTSFYKRLLPTKAGSKGINGKPVVNNALTNPNRPSLSPRTCSVITIACDQCRRKKAKCGGQRPICERCARNGTHCHFDAYVGETRTSTLKQKYGALDMEIRRLREESHQFKKLYGLIQTATENEALEVFRRIRSSNNYSLIAIPSLLGQGDDSQAERTVSAPKIKGDREDAVETSNACVVEVQASPWTIVAGNDVVSELISQYFTFDYLYVFPPIPCSIFLFEMKKGDPAMATACTPLLVNAICAQQCFLSPKDSFGITPRRDMAERFLQEASTLLQNETRRTSLATCQATCLMHAAMAIKNEIRDAL